MQARAGALHGERDQEDSERWDCAELEAFPEDERGDVIGKERNLKSQPPVDIFERVMALKLLAQLHSSQPIFVVHRVWY